MRILLYIIWRISDSVRSMWTLLRVDIWILFLRTSTLSSIHWPVIIPKAFTSWRSAYSGNVLLDVLSCVPSVAVGQSWTIHSWSLQFLYFIPMTVLFFFMRWANRNVGWCIEITFKVFVARSSDTFVLHCLCFAIQLYNVNILNTNVF